MIVLRWLAIFAWFAAGGAMAAQWPVKGSLVIVGGALSAENEAVHRAFIARALGPQPRFAIIPSASGSPASSAEAMRQTLIRYGVPSSRIDVVKLAVVDDPGTPKVNEALWDNAANTEEIAKIQRAGAIWFTGGDQARTTKRLLLPGIGADSAMLKALRLRLSQGAVIGGSSAGAAIMTEIMIARGDSMQSLVQPIERDPMADDRDGGPLAMAKGLGFLPIGLADQHFDRRARLGRLARALFEREPSNRIGFGIDEDTGFIVDFATRSARVVGKGGVTLIDGRQGKEVGSEAKFAAQGLEVSWLTEGDTLNLESLNVRPATYKKPTIGNEYYDQPALNGGGMAVPNNALSDALGMDLLDNAAVKRIERTSFDGMGRGVRYIFAETAYSVGWVGTDPKGNENYTIARVGFDIQAVDVTITEAIAAR